MILVDAHVHVHGCFDLQNFLDSALGNFRTEAARRQQGDFFSGVLLLTESAQVNWFQRFAFYADKERLIGRGNNCNYWTFSRTNEACSLRAECAAGPGLFVIAGRQIITAEKLEVLALATEKEFVDGLPLQQVIQTVTENDAIPVIPWGFGKWMGKRGRFLMEKLKRADKSDFFLGDNGGRPIFLPRPYHFKLAESRGIRVLPGSDTLPFASEYLRPGGFGFSVEGRLNPKQPASDIKRILLDTTARPRPYGALEMPYRFFRHQLAMQILKQRRKPDQGD